MAGSSGNISLCADLPDPFTPTPLLPPQIVSQTTLPWFVLACSVAVLVWDQLHTLCDDYKLAFKMHFRWPTAVYFLSRISTLIFVVARNVELNFEIDHCEIAVQIVTTSFVLSRASTAFLMYFRMCAVYSMNIFVVLFFGFTWLSVIGGAATTYGGMKSAYIGNTKYCTCAVNHPYVITTSVIDCINDTLILLAIMYKLGTTGIRRTPDSQLSSAWKPTGHLQGFVRAFLQDSQIYYAIAVVLNFATIINFFAAINSLDSHVRVTMLYPNAVIVNIMACRVFRNVKLGRHSQILVVPTQINTGNLTERNYKPDSGMENSYDTRDSEMNIHMSAEFSPRKEFSWIPTTRVRTEKPSAHLGGVEVTTVIELTRD